MRRFAHAIAAVVAIASVARAEHVIVGDPEVSRPRVTTGRFAMTQLMLPSGLGVILVPDARASSVVVHLRYESGTASERPGEAGFTHVIEGLLGMASAHRTDFVAQIEAQGGWTTARAAQDHLGTTTRVPAHALERLLWLEAERMAGLADGLGPLWLARAKERTQAAWRAAYADAPYALVDRALSAGLWPARIAGHGRPVLGDGKAVEAATPELMRAFVKRRLVPNNAVLVIAGPIDAKTTRRLVERYFGWMPPRDAVLRAVNRPPRSQRIETTIKGTSSAVAVGYTARPYDPALAIAALVLAGDRHSRLYGALVDRGLASDVRAEIVRHKTAGDELRIHATPLRGTDPRSVASAIRFEVERLVTDATDAEVRQAAARIELDFYLAAENLAVRAELLAATFFAGSHGPSIFDWWPERLRELRAKDMTMVSGAFGAPVTVIGREDLP
jgi:zinc protease